MLKAHELARQLLAGPDATVVAPTYDEDNDEQYVEVKSTEPLPQGRLWYDANSNPREDPAVSISTSVDKHDGQ